MKSALGNRRGHGLGESGGHGDDLMITPLLDLFVALIPFLIMSVVLTKINVVDVGIAKPVASASSSADSFDLTVKLNDHQAEVRLNGKAYGVVAMKDSAWLEQVHKKLVEIKKKNPDQIKIRIEAQGNITLEKMMSLMDSARKLTATDESIQKKDEQGRTVKLQYLFPHVILRGVYGS